ncbi:hypothetical protein HF086_001838 [Spodoptera exigua]|uniref:Uncharacterized protein n=1 Tax=Spodoptera exigua TaxID=7107 RepID=A0A922MA51_SPOEX|nr:hypothetical protein HF086_001838 [Spodoptera exigua]
MDWLLPDNTVAGTLKGLRRILANGSLELSPFPAEHYRRDVHATTYRCRLRLSSGFAILSKNIHVHAAVRLVLDQKIGFSEIQFNKS